MCCKCYSLILTLKGNICLLEMTIGRLMIALLPVHLCSAMVPRAQGERVHEAQTSDQLTLCPMGMGVSGVDVVVVSIGELLISELTERRSRRGADGRPDCVFFSDRAHSTGRQYRCSQCGVGLPYSQEL